MSPPPPYLSKFTKVKKIKLQVKKVIDSQGVHNMDGQRRFKEIVEYSVDDFEKHFNKNSNEKQIKRLSIQRYRFSLDRCGDRCGACGIPQQRHLSDGRVCRHITHDHLSAINLH